MKIVLSWSGNRSRHIAEGLQEWLPKLNFKFDVFCSLLQDREALTETARLEDTPFSPVEVDRISVELQELNAFIKSSVSLSEQSQQRIEGQLEYLREATSRLGKRDWIGLFIGVVINIIFTSPEVQTQAQSIFQFAVARIAGALNIVQDAVRGLLG